MPQSLHQNYAHIIFSTKNRKPQIDTAIEAQLYAYLGGTAKDLGAVLLAANGMPDHVHLLIRSSKSISDIEFLKKMKGNSSKWMEEQGYHDFYWQVGYAWFSVSARDLEKARTYLANQKEHHKQVSFKEELVRFLEQYKVEYDERYLWD